MKIILAFLLLVTHTTVFAGDSGKDLYKEDCYSNCHKGSPRDDYTGMVILDKFDLRSIVISCSNHFAPFWSQEERGSVIDYLYRNYYEPSIEDPFS